MRRLLFLAFLVVPLIEIALFILIGQAIGIVPTLLGVLVMAVAGAMLVRRQGLSLLTEIRGTVGRGQLPARAIGDAMMVGVAGLLLLTPGYFTDLLGLLLLLPPVRPLVYRELARRVTVVAAGSARRSAGPRTIDLDGESWRPR
jgi:UPF0716 protein FxsA